MSSCTGSPLLVYCTEVCVLFCSVPLPCNRLVCIVCPVVFVMCVGFWVWEFLKKVGRIRFPGEVGELATFVGVPYLT